MLRTFEAIPAPALQDLSVLRQHDEVVRAQVASTLAQVGIGESTQRLVNALVSQAQDNAIELLAAARDAQTANGAA